MDRPALNDPAVFPDDPLLARQFGPAKSAWDDFMALLKANVPVLAAEWRYYNDGKSWLYKVTHKTKTVCWVSAWEKFFKTGFYFTAKAETAIRGSALAPEIKNSFLHPVGKGSLRPIAIEVRKKSDLQAVAELIAIKLQIK